MSATGNWGWFELYNVTQNTVAQLSVEAPQGVPFDGHSAEWILERPGVSTGGLGDLANYTTATVTGAWATDYSGQTHLYTSDTSHQVTMIGKAATDVLSSVAPLGPKSMVFTWHNDQ